MKAWIIAVEVERKKQDREYEEHAWIETDDFVFRRVPVALLVEVPPNTPFIDWAGLTLVRRDDVLYFPIDGFFTSYEAAQEGAEAQEEDDDWYVGCPLQDVCEP